jgi:hypothetical protein
MSIWPFSTEVLETFNLGLIELAHFQNLVGFRTRRIDPGILQQKLEVINPKPYIRDQERGEKKRERES